MKNVEVHPRNWSPQGVVYDLQKNIEEIQSIIVIVEHTDGTHSRYVTDQSVKEAVYKKEMLTQNINQLMGENGF